jgi:ZIP family zinc transporter
LSEILKTTLMGLFFGTFGTTIGGMIGSTVKNISNRFLSFILEFAAGLMMAVVCFELIPESIQISRLPITFLGIILGVFSMIICDSIIKNKFRKKKYASTNENSLLKTGIIVGIGLAIHNFPEGLAIGSGFEASYELGFSLALAIALHDVPEGISMSVPIRVSGIAKNKVLIYTILSGITTGMGAFFGAIMGNISQELISICLSFSAGAMLYIVSGELIPESNKLYKGRLASIGNIMGFIIGIIASNI